VPECQFARKEGCKSIALLAKVSSTNDQVHMQLHVICNVRKSLE
jgi:hypothetical protein